MAVSKFPYEPVRQEVELVDQISDTGAGFSYHDCGAVGTSNGYVSSDTTPATVDRTTTTTPPTPTAPPPQPPLTENSETTATGTDGIIEDRVVTASGVASAVVGFLMLGPIGSMLLGFGAAYAAKHKPIGNCIGDTARAVGDAALYTTSKLRTINDRHHVSARTEEIAKNSYETIIEPVDRKYCANILHRLSTIAKRGVTSASESIRRNNLVERGVQSIGKGVCSVAEAIGNQLSSFRSTSRSSSPPPPPPELFVGHHPATAGDTGDGHFGSNNRAGPVSSPSLPPYKCVPC